jgi:hypothetical protein
MSAPPSESATAGLAGKPAPRASRQASRRSGYRARLLLLLAVAALAAVVVTISIALLQARSRDNVVHAAKGVQQAGPVAGPAETTAILIGSQPESPVPVATRSAGDLATWIQKSASMGSRGERVEDTDDPVCVNLYLAGRIVLVPDGTRVQILGGDGAWRRVLVLEGSHKGTVGFTPRQNAPLAAAPTAAGPS